MGGSPGSCRRSPPERFPAECRCAAHANECEAVNTHRGQNEKRHIAAPAMEAEARKKSNPTNKLWQRL